MFKHGGEEKQRFSIRKYSTGVFSSLVGVAGFIFGSSQEVVSFNKINYYNVGIYYFC